MKRLLLVKETRAGEARVALIPEDVSKLITEGFEVSVEWDAGQAAGFDNADYQAAGATVLPEATPLAESFRQQDIIVRAKRPDPAREAAEFDAIQPHTAMIGALDPFDTHTGHVAQYHQHHVQAYSIDQLDCPADDPRNLLSAMSHLTGELAFQDAVKRHTGQPKSLLILGFGTAGRAAFETARQAGFTVTVALRDNPEAVQKIESAGGHALIYDRQAPIIKQQAQILTASLDADIIIACARRANTPAPRLIPASTLAKLKPNTVVVDLALSEGGNVEGSAHDQTITLSNGVIIHNISGYPKAMPKKASKLWSSATRHFIISLQQNTLDLQPL